MIKITDLTLTIKGGRNLLDHVNLNINAGDRIAIVGGNGAGKTTLVETIIGIKKKTSGNIVFDFDYQKSPLEKVGVQFQESNFPLGLATGQIIEFFIEKTKSPNKKLIDKLIEEFGINDFYYTDASKLSGGQAQKLNVILALTNSPRLVILDELTTGLDVVAKTLISKAIKEYLESDKEISMLLVSHTEHEIRALANRIIVMSHGKLIKDTTPSEVLKEYATIGDFLSTLTA